MGELVPGGNQALPDGALTIRVPGPFDLSALITGEDGKVAGDGDFVFFNQPTAPGARLDGDTVTLRPRGPRPGAARVTLVISPADPDTPLGRLPAPVLSVLDERGAPLARFAPPRPSAETVPLLAEIYRRGGGRRVGTIGSGRRVCDAGRHRAPRDAFRRIRSGQALSRSQPPSPPHMLAL